MSEETPSQPEAEATVDTSQEEVQPPASTGAEPQYPPPPVAQGLCVYYKQSDNHLCLVRFHDRFVVSVSLVVPM